MVLVFLLQIKVIGKLGAVTTRVGVADSDQQAKTQWNDLNKGQKLSKRLELEPVQKLIVKIGASDTLHQVFVIFRNKESKKEVALIAQPETEGKTDYKLELVIYIQNISLTSYNYCDDVYNTFVLLTYV